MVFPICFYNTLHIYFNLVLGKRMAAVLYITSYDGVFKLDNLMATTVLAQW